MKSVRDDFPILKKSIYLDSASTSLTPEPVLQAVIEYYREYNANTGRGVYSLAQIAGQRYREAHRKVSEFIGAKEDVVFTKNSTESINLVARGVKWSLGDRIVTSLVEHHSNLLPWMRLRNLGLELDIVKPGLDGVLEISDFEKAISKGAKLVALTQASNVLGTVLPVKEISEICRDFGALLLVDAAQSAPHMPIDVDDLGCDFLCFSGHKMLGPKGTGVLWIRGDEAQIDPLMLGGGTVEDVSTDEYHLKEGYERFEAGSQDIPGFIGLGRAVDYLRGIGMEEISAHERVLTEKMLSGLLEIDGVEVYGPHDPKGHSGVVSFNIPGLDPHEVALMLEEAAEIMIRSGHHCCMPLMKHLGLKMGTARASIYLYNTEEEVEKFLSTVEEIAGIV